VPLGDIVAHIRNVQPLSNFIYLLAFLELLSLIRVVHFLHRQLCPLGALSIRANILKFYLLIRVVSFLHGQLCPLGALSVMVNIVTFYLLIGVLRITNSD